MKTNYNSLNLKYILKNKKPVAVKDVLVWAKWIETEERRVALSDVAVGKQRVRVSTVFLGLDHNFSNKGRPILFETLVTGGEHDQFMERYCTWAEAEKGHARILKMIKRNK